MKDDNYKEWKYSGKVKNKKAQSAYFKQLQDSSMFDTNTNPETPKENTLYHIHWILRELFLNLSLSPFSNIRSKYTFADKPQIPMTSKQLSPKSGEKWMSHLSDPVLLIQSISYRDYVSDQKHAFLFHLCGFHSSTVNSNHTEARVLNIFQRHQ